MWDRIHNKLFFARDSARGDAKAAQAFLLAASYFDSSPPATETEALETVRQVLSGTQTLKHVERAMSRIVR